jgi:hypothetical protein
MFVPPFRICLVQAFRVSEATMRVTWLPFVAQLAHRKQMQVWLGPRLVRRPIQMMNVQLQIGSAAKLASPVISLKYF